MDPVEISVIVPVYNAEKYLCRCVDSILSQQFASFELILIDDGSTDASVTICDEYATVDSRVRIFHKSNGGVSSARNLGLDHARGEWITFVDADDWVEKNYLLNLIRYSENTDMVFNYATIEEFGVIYKEVYPEQFVDCSQYDVLLRSNDLIWHSSPWSKLFRLSIIRRNNLYFPEGMHIGEDAFFLFSYISNCSNIKVVCSCDYHYIIDKRETLTRRVNSFQSEYDGYKKILIVAEKLREYCKGDKNLENSKVGWLTGSYQRRCLNALYHDSISRKERVLFLKSQNYNDYLTAIKENSIQGKLYQCLLRYRAFRIYDFIRSFLLRFKR